MTQQEARERFSIMQASHFQEQNAPQQVPPRFPATMPSGTAQQQLAAFSQRAQVSTNNQMNPLQRVIQAQDPSSHARPFGMLLAQNQQQQNNSGFGSRVGQNVGPPEMGLSSGPGSLQQNFVSPSPSVLPANIQSSSAPSASQAPTTGGQQIPGPNNLSEIPLNQLRNFYTQLMRAVMEGEKNIQAASSSGGDGDIQRQIRAKVDLYKQRMLALQEVISSKMRASGDPTQQVVNGQSWIAPGQRASGLYPVAERSSQHNSPLHQASANQVAPQRNMSTPQQNYLPPSTTPQPNLTQTPHVSGNGLPLPGVLSQMTGTGAPPQQSPQIPSQLPIQPNKIPPLTEDRFKAVFLQYRATTGIRLSERDLMIEGRQINIWALHKAVFLRNGFDSVTTNDEWPVIGAALGFPSFTGGDAGQPARCAPAVALRLHQIYNEVLRHFDQAYINSVITRLRNSQASGQMPQIPPQPAQTQALPHQPTEADYKALLASITSESSVMNSDAMSILPRFSHTSGADLEAHRVPQNVIAFVEQNREHLQRAAQDQKGFRAGLTSTKNQPLDNTQVNQASAHQALARPPQLIPGNQGLQQLPRQASAQGPGKSTTLPPGQPFNTAVGPLSRVSASQSMSASGMPSMGSQIAGSNPNGVAQGQGGAMSVPMNPAAMNSVASGSILPQPAGPMQIRRPTAEEVVAAKRWVDEQKRMAFNRDFDGVAGYPATPESDIQEYHRNLERLDHALANIEKYIHIAFAVLKKEDVVQRMFTMMASAKVQLEEFKKPKPRYVLELHTIRGMIQEADNMDKGLKTVLGLRMHPQMMPPGGVPSASQPPLQQPSAAALPPFVPPIPPTAPPVATTLSRPPHGLPLQTSQHRKKLSQSQAPGAAISTPTPPPIPTTSTPTPQATTPGITAPSPQTPKSPKGKAPKPKQPGRRKASTKANSLETPQSAHSASSIPTASTPEDAKGGVKRVREDETDAPTPGVTSAPSPKRTKPDWEGAPNEEVRKRDEQAENVKTDEQAMAFVEHVTKFIDENPESAEAASSALEAILRTYPPAPDMEDPMVPTSFSFGDLPPTSPPHATGHDIFGDFIDYTAFEDTPTPDLVAGSSTNPSPESASDQDHPHTGRAGPSPQISNAKVEDAYDLLRPTVWQEIAGGDQMFHQAQGWRWDGPMETPDQAWAISTS
ncbi:hypothetical protein F5148DRAFT_560177 [Russula earlei]|uniref:Uncharacterized protein n=1 Tax=Russula earlei TaxID=71964 RepID=A0ACC0UMP3_9AGAM|nr:hypothetical protein F5148DRAFT_560177 [Russula earlei]